MGVFPCVGLLVLVWIGSAWFMRSGVQAFRVCFRSAEGLTGRGLCAVLRDSRRPLWICGYFQVSGVPLLFVFGCLCLAVWVLGLGSGLAVVFVFRFAFCFADGTGTGSAVLRFCFSSGSSAAFPAWIASARFCDPLILGG